MLINILLVVFMLSAVVMVVLILLQQGKGADAGAAFGGGSSQSLFGARGSANFLSRVTAVLATLFLLSSLGLAYLYNGVGERKSVTVIEEKSETTTENVAPAENVLPAVPEVVTEPAGGGVPAVPQSD
ncbi:MAG: preprotein translocase subunit SecG [Arenicellales bacterium]|jgi:preprotein translocase subunit SecG|nr:preprotein translocase subunit SecG [Acidiferrobacteraceae bacterium]MDP7521705.1 preprotein translocase subunit SecG [Arenicellales bacterium]|tara:strand:+ start:847 stop:1230 length:384 start_codon:yes stop_codon:yes gene_type:complete